MKIPCVGGPLDGSTSDIGDDFEPEAMTYLDCVGVAFDPHIGEERAVFSKIAHRYVGAYESGRWIYRYAGQQELTRE